MSKWSSGNKGSPRTPPAPWTLFQWGSRGLWYFTDEEDVFMPHIFIPDGVRSVLFGVGESGQEYLHTFGVQVPGGGPPTYTDCVAINLAIAGWVENVYKNMWASGIRPEKVVSTGMNAMPAAQASRAVVTPGVRVGISMPSEISLYVEATTHLSGRRNHGGQAAWPPTQIDMLSQDRVQAAYKTAIAGAFNDLLTRVSTAGYALAVASLVDGAMKPIAVYIANDDVVDSRRRRTINRGR